MDLMKLEEAGSDEARNPHGIVIQDRRDAIRPPAISAFIWGGKISPVPQLPYGRRSAA